ncbi:MAG: sigma-70 family RNA polymerase sigma factor [Anaerolineae bacterium]
MAFTLPDIETEDRLLALARRGSQQAVSEIYERYFPSVYRFVRLHLESQHEAEDIAADVFFQLVDHLGKPSGPRQSLRGWLFRIARHEVYRHYGRQQKMPTVTLDEWLPASNFDETEGDLEIGIIRHASVERIRRLLRMLAPEQQEVLILRFSEELSLQETADMMNKSVSAIKSLQFRAVDTLRKLLLSSTENGESGTYGD